MPTASWTQGTRITGGSGTIAWPAAAEAGHLAICHFGGKVFGPQTSGWSAVGYKSFWKILTAADLTAPLPIKGDHVKLSTFAAAGGIGRTSSQPGLTLQHATSGLWVEASRWGAGITPDATYRQGVESLDVQGASQGAYYRQGTAAAYLSIPVNSGAVCYSYEILPPLAPAAPILVSPAAAERVDAALPLTFRWLHQSPNPAGGFKLQVSPGGWADYDGTLDVEAGLIDSGQSWTLAAGQLTPGTTYQWRAATIDIANGSGFGAGWSPLSALRTFYADAAPTVSSITVTSTAGDLSPSIAWAGTAGYGTLVAQQVLIAPAASTNPDADAVWDSGVVSGVASPVIAPNTVEWTNGASLRAWVRVWQTGGVAQLVADDATFAVSWTPPATPTITAAAGTPTVVTVAGLTVGNLVTVESQVAALGWQSLGTRTVAAASLSIAAPLPPTGSSVTFRARQSALVDGVPMQSAWATSSAVTVTDATAYLVDDADRSSYLAVEQDPGTDSRRVIVQGTSTSYGLGATSARVDQSPPAGQVGSFTLRADSETEAASIWAWLAARSAFWFRQAPDAYGAKAVQPVRVRRVSQLGTDRLAESSGWRNISVEWVEQPE